MKTRQLSIFDQPHRVIAPADPTLTPAERKRLSDRGRPVLERLRRGPALGPELNAMFGWRFGAAIYDVREAGCVVARTHVGGGVHKYELIHEPEGLT